MCSWVTMLYSRKLTEHCKLAIMKKYIYKNRCPCELVVSSQQDSMIFMNVYLKSSYPNISSNISTGYHFWALILCYVLVNLVITIIL